MTVEEVGEAGYGEDEAGDEVVPGLQLGVIYWPSETKIMNTGTSRMRVRVSLFGGRLIHTKLSSNLLFYNSTIQIVKVAVVHQHIIELCRGRAALRWTRRRCRPLRGHRLRHGRGRGRSSSTPSQRTRTVWPHLCASLLGHDAGLDLHHQLSALVLDFLTIWPSILAATVFSRRSRQSSPDGRTALPSRCTGPRTALPSHPGSPR